MDVGANEAAVVANGLATNPLAWMVVLLLGAVVGLFKLLHDAQGKRLEDREKANAETRELLQSILPLSSKLTDAVELLDRAIDRATRGGD